VQNNDQEPSRSPQTFWEFLDKWLHKLGEGGKNLAPFVKVALTGGVIVYLVLVAWRIWLISHALTTFGVDVESVLPVSPTTGALIRRGLSVLVLFAPDAIFAYVLFGRHVEYWRTWTIVALVCAVGASWWVTHVPGIGTHCYVVTPDRGLIESYADKNGQCGLDRPTGLQMSPVTQDILLCIRAMQRGIKPHKLATSAVNAAEMFDASDGHSLYWFHQDGPASLDFYDGPGFDQATLTPLKPVTRQNAEKIRHYIKQQQDAERAAQEKAAAEEKAAADQRARKELALAQEAQRLAAEEHVAGEKLAAEQKAAEADRIRQEREVKITKNLSLYISSVAVSNQPNRETLVATLTFRNHSAERILIALDGRLSCGDLRLTDGRGGLCEACANGEDLTTLPIINRSSLVRNAAPFSMVAPMSTAQHVVYFYNRRCSSEIRQTEGLSLNGSLLVDEGRGVELVPISISGLTAIR
jgi:hypothetical protein